MSTLAEAVRDFLASERIAVVGVSRDSRQPANAIYRKLRASGRRVAATNPRTETVEGDPCYPDLRTIPGGVDAVVVAAPALAHRCARTVLGWFGKLPRIEIGEKS